MTIHIEIQGERARVAAVEYIKQQLVQGKSLAKFLLETLDFESGESAALSATPLTPGEIAHYRQGHASRTDSVPRSIVIGGTTHAAYPTPSANEQLADAIYALLGSPADLCLLENSIAQVGDPYLMRAKSRLLFHGSEVYHALCSVDHDQARIINAVREAERPPAFVGAVGRMPWSAGADIAALSVVTTEELAKFARSAFCVFVGAYDGEGYLVWRRSSGEPQLPSQ